VVFSAPPATYLKDQRETNCTAESSGWTNWPDNGVSMSSHQTLDAHKLSPCDRFHGTNRLTEVNGTFESVSRQASVSVLAYGVA